MPRVWSLTTLKKQLPQLRLELLLWLALYVSICMPLALLSTAIAIDTLCVPYRTVGCLESLLHLESDRAEPVMAAA